MQVNRKVADFIKLEDGNIGRKAAVVTGALLASTVLGAVLTVQVAEAHCDGWHWENCHSDTPQHSDGYGCHNNWHYDMPDCI